MRIKTHKKHGENGTDDGVMAQTTTSLPEAPLPSTSTTEGHSDAVNLEDLVAQNIAGCTALTDKLPPKSPQSMPDGSVRRILIELRDIKEWANRGEAWYTLRPIFEDRLDTFLGTLLGPKGTPYEGGIFHVRFNLGEEYPFKPPEMWFLTKVFHPNIDERGTICMRLEWSPSLTMEALLASAASLLDSPGWSDPMPDGPAAPLVDDEEKFDEEARQWTKKFATGEIVSPGEGEDGFCNTTEAAVGWMWPVAWVRRRANSRAYGLFER